MKPHRALAGTVLYVHGGGGPTRREHGDATGGRRGWRPDETQSPEGGPQTGNSLTPNGTSWKVDGEGEGEVKGNERGTVDGHRDRTHRRLASTPASRTERERDGSLLMP
jgi:hypothetical protein